MADFDDIINGLVQTDTKIINKINELDANKASQEDLDNIDLSLYQTKSDTSLTTNNKTITGAINELSNTIQNQSSSLNSSINSSNSQLSSAISSNTSAHQSINNKLDANTSKLNDLQAQLDSITSNIQDPTISSFRIVSTTASGEANIEYVVQNLTNTVIHRCYINSVPTVITPSTTDNSTFKYTLTDIKTHDIISVSIHTGVSEVLSSPVAVTLQDVTIYGYRVNTSTNEVTYIEDCANFKPVTSTSYGDWENTFIWDSIQPKAFAYNNTTGAIEKEYTLSKSNMWYDVNNEYIPQALTSYEYADYMVEISRIYVKVNPVGNGYYEVRFTNVPKEGYEAYAHKCMEGYADYLYVSSFPVNKSGFSRGNPFYYEQSYIANPTSPTQNVPSYFIQYYRGLRSLNGTCETFNTHNLLYQLICLVLKSVNISNIVPPSTNYNAIYNVNTPRPFFNFGDPHTLFGITYLWGSDTVFLDGLTVSLDAAYTGTATQGYYLNTGNTIMLHNTIPQSGLYPAVTTSKIVLEPTLAYNPNPNYPQLFAFPVPNSGKSPTEGPNVIARDYGKADYNPQITGGITTYTLTNSTTTGFMHFQFFR